MLAATGEAWRFLLHFVSFAKYGVSGLHLVRDGSLPSGNLPFVLGVVLHASCLVSYLCHAALVQCSNSLCWLPLYWLLWCQVLCIMTAFISCFASRRFDTLLLLSHSSHGRCMLPSGTYWAALGYLTDVIVSDPRVLPESAVVWLHLMITQ